MYRLPLLLLLFCANALSNNLIELDSYKEKITADDLATAKPISSDWFKVFYIPAYCDSNECDNGHYLVLHPDYGVEGYDYTVKKISSEWEIHNIKTLSSERNSKKLYLNGKCLNVVYAISQVVYQPFKKKTKPDLRKGFLVMYVINEGEGLDSAFFENTNNLKTECN